MPHKKECKSSEPHRWLAFGIISSVYFFVNFHRVSTSVIASDLLAAFQTDATALGVVSSMYFYPYALEQPLVGHLSDRLGPRLLIGLWTLAAALGSLLFALAPGPGWAAVGRGLIGIGTGGVYVAAIKAFSQWFPIGEFGTMTGLFLALGNLGAIAATIPLAWIADTWGWRLSFLSIGGISFGLAFATFVLIRDPDSTPELVGEELVSRHQQTTAPQGWALHVLASLEFWILAALLFGVSGVCVTFQGLWATPFLISVLKLDRLHASGLNMLIPVGFILGVSSFGWLTDRIYRNKVNVIMCVLGMQTGIWVCLTFVSHTQGIVGMMALLLFLGGTTGEFVIALWALVREITPSTFLGVTSGFLNQSPILGMAVLQGLTGVILERVGRIGGIYPPAAYREAFLFCLLIIASCLILSGCLRRCLRTKDSDS